MNKPYQDYLGLSLLFFDRSKLSSIAIHSRKIRLIIFIVELMHSPGNPKLPIVDLSLHVNKSKLSMNFNIALTMDTRAGIKSHILSNLSIYLKKSFKDKDYGADLLNYTLGYTSVQGPEGYEHFFEKKKPLYVSDRTTKNRFSGEQHHMYKLFIDSIVIEPDQYEDFVSGTDLHSLEIIKAKILESLSNLDRLPKKVKDFDKERFRIDMRNLLAQTDDMQIISSQP